MKSILDIDQRTQNCIRTLKNMSQQKFLRMKKEISESLNSLCQIANMYSEGAMSRNVYVGAIPLRKLNTKEGFRNASHMTLSDTVNLLSRTQEMLRNRIITPILEETSFSSQRRLESSSREKTSRSNYENRDEKWADNEKIIKALNTIVKKVEEMNQHDSINLEQISESPIAQVNLPDFGATQTDLEVLFESPQKHEASLKKPKRVLVIKPRSEFQNPIAPIPAAKSYRPLTLSKLIQGFTQKLSSIQQKKKPLSPPKQKVQTINLPTTHKRFPPTSSPNIENSPFEKSNISTLALAKPPEQKELLHDFSSSTEGFINLANRNLNSSSIDENYSESLPTPQSKRVEISTPRLLKKISRRELKKQELLDYHEVFSRSRIDSQQGSPQIKADKNMFQELKEKLSKEVSSSEKKRNNYSLRFDIGNIYINNMTPYRRRQSPQLVHTERKPIQKHRFPSFRESCPDTRLDFSKNEIHGSKRFPISPIPANQERSSLRSHHQRLNNSKEVSGFTLGGLEKQEPAHRNLKDKAGFRKEPIIEGLHLALPPNTMFRKHRRTVLHHHL